MDVKGAVSFAEAAGCQKIRPGREWVQCTCPLAHVRHASGQDSHPSCAISIDDKDASTLHCFACGYKGSLTYVAWKLGRSDLFRMSLKDNIPDLSWSPAGDTVAERIDKLPAYWNTPEKSAVPMYQQHLIPPVNKVMDESILKSFQPMPDRVRAYLHKRGIADSTIEEWELGYAADKNRISIPIRNEVGELVSVSGRAFGNQRPKYLHSPFKRNIVLYGEHLMDLGKPGYLVEGFFQAMALWQAGYTNAVARLGTHLSNWQMDKLDRCFKNLVIVPDGDEAGRSSASKIYKEMKDRMPCRVVNMPDGKDADSISVDELRKIIDVPENSLDTAAAS